jgi:Ca-activated chloride channel family protein
VQPNVDAGLSAGPPTAEARGGFGGMMGRMARSQGAAVKAPRAPGGGGIPALRRSLPESEQQPQVAKVRQIGTKTFYFKNGRWVDSSVTPEEDAKAVKIVQFSDDYFKIARAQKAEYNQYFSQAEPVTVKLEGTVYHVDPAP